MPENGIIVLDGTTIITHYNTNNGIICAKASPFINVAAGASLTIDAITLPQPNRGFWYLDNSSAMIITNNGSLNWKMAQANTGFYVNGLSTLTMNFVPQSNTMISAKFTINSVNLVRLNSSLTTTSILGTDSTQMPISL